MKLPDISINGTYRASQDIETSKGRIPKDTTVRVVSKQGVWVFVDFNGNVVKVRPDDLKA